ncbi:hypothetical protein JCM3770_003645 [Rhodotorula araucariae]
MRTLAASPRATLTAPFRSPSRVPRSALAEHAPLPSDTSATLATRSPLSSALASSSQSYYLARTHAPTTADIVAAYRRALADEAAFRGVSQAELRAARDGDDEPDAEDEPLRPLQVEMTALLGPRRRGVKRDASDDDGCPAPRSVSLPGKKRRVGVKGVRSSAVAKAFVPPRATPVPQRAATAGHDDDELLVALDALIAAPHPRCSRAPRGPPRLGNGSEGEGSSQPAGQARSPPPPVARTAPQCARTSSTPGTDADADDAGEVLRRACVDPAVLGWREGFGAFDS